MKPPGGECHDLFGAAFNGSPSHLRVLKPPGGGSSDIFGGNNESLAADARRVRTKAQQQQSSQLFLGSTSCSIASSSSTSSASSTASDTPSNGVVAPSNGVSSAAPKKINDGNPVTGEGYDVSSKPSTPLTNGNSSNAPSTPSTAQTRQRVPPGGFSSGLW